jgi:hypothetical protein
MECCRIGVSAFLLFGLVCYSAPTHKEMIEAMTPQPCSDPVAAVGALFGWLTSKSQK